MNLSQQRGMIWFWLAAGRGCGAVATDANGVVRQTCPYFSHYYGRLLNHVILDLRERGVDVRWKRLADPRPSTVATPRQG